MTLMSTVCKRGAAEHMISRPCVQAQDVGDPLRNADFYGPWRKANVPTIARLAAGRLEDVPLLDVPKNPPPCPHF